MLAESRRVFTNQVGDSVKEEIVKNSESLYKKNLIKIENAAAEERRRQNYIAKVEKEKAEGTYVDTSMGEDNSTTWGRGTKIHEARAAQSEYESRMTERNQQRSERPPPAEDTGFARGMFTRSTNEAPPRQERQERQEDDKREAGGFSKGGPPVFSRGGNAPRREPAAAQGSEDNSGLGFRSGNTMRGLRGNRGGDRGGFSGRAGGDREAAGGGFSGRAGGDREAAGAGAGFTGRAGGDREAAGGNGGPP